MTFVRRSPSDVVIVEEPCIEVLVSDMTESCTEELLNVQCIGAFLSIGYLSRLAPVVHIKRNSQCSGAVHDGCARVRMLR